MTLPRPELMTAPRMFCDCCGEEADLIENTYMGSTGYFVTCKREGKMCCQTHDCPTAERAIRAWKTLQLEPDSE